MNPVLSTLHEIARLNHKLFINCLADVDESTWTRRAGESANHMAAIACHIVGARYYLASLMGKDIDVPLKQKLFATKNVDDMDEIPSVAEVKKAWAELGRDFAGIFDTIGDEQLAVDSGQPFPVEDKSLVGGLNFLIAHESYHIGQLALLRRTFGLAPMSYS